jgi:hypothetical protein
MSRSPPGTYSLQPTTDRKVHTQRVQQLVDGNHVAATTRKALQDNETVTAGLANLPGTLGSCPEGAGRGPLSGEAAPRGIHHGLTVPCNPEACREGR